MPERRILILYLHEHSGHHRAALALEKAFKEIDPKIKCRSVDALRYTHPLLEKLIQGTYLQIVKSEPEVWERLYDNPLILKTIQKLRLATYRSESKRFKAFLEDFRPSAVLCTQAFPCGVVSDYKSTCSGLLPLYGVLTDFFPHAYWPAENVNGYFVPAEEAKGKLRERGVASDKIFVTGIPVDVFNRENHDASSNVPLVLVMGGS
ncbi:MAG: hypothetical protein HY593_02430, partial [Candidatus Omnitrophica bacterium]|nr:hypothetical protein [Candidatus Omnitrophota bacterium]